FRGKDVARAMKGARLRKERADESHPDGACRIRALRWVSTLRGSALALHTPRAVASRSPGAPRGYGRMIGGALANHPGLCFRVDKFSVPDVARGEFEVAMRRTMGLLEQLPGFLVHAVFEENDAAAFNIVTLVAWESRRALDAAAAKMRGYRDEMGFDLP